MAIVINHLSLALIIFSTLFSIQSSSLENQQSHGFESPSIDVILNPNKINEGDNSTLILVVKNNNSSLEIESAKVVLPWENKNILTEPIIVNSNELVSLNAVLNIPKNTPAGNYELLSIINTNLSDYFSKTNFTVDSFQVFSLTGEIPLVVIAIVIPGLISYLIIIHFLFRNFERGHLEIGMASIGLGILNWWILNSYTGNSLTTIVRSSSSLDYLLIFLISIGVASTILAILFLLKWGHSKVQGSKTIRKFNESLYSVGFAEKEESVFYTFMKDQIAFSKKFGQKYSFRVRIYLKDPTVISNFKSIEGLVKHFNPDPPHSIVVVPKINTVCTKSDLISQLFEDEWFLKLRLLNNSQIKKNVVNYISVSDEDPIDNILTSLKQTLLDNDVEFLSRALMILNLTYQDTMTLAMELENKKLARISQQYNDYSFIKGESISKIEIISYETNHSIVIEEDGKKAEFPEPYLIKDLLPGKLTAED
ncbi:MAG: hypothetical protein AB7U98_01140 [Candidatus Nitrosocosmicus sp.]